MVLLEAAAFGLPMVAFDIKTGPREIVEHGVNGYLCHEDSDQEMIDAICDLIDQPAKRGLFAEASRAAAQRFSIEEICAQWIMVLQKVVRSKRAQSRRHT